MGAETTALSRIKVSIDNHVTKSLTKLNVFRLHTFVFNDHA